MSLVPVCFSIDGHFALSLQQLGLGLLDEHVGPRFGGCCSALGTKGKGGFGLSALARALFPGSAEGLLCSGSGQPAGQPAGRVALVQPVLATVRLHVLCKSKFLTAIEAAERLLPRVQVLVLMEEAAVLERLSTDVAEVRAHAGRVLTPVIFHDRVVFEDHATLGAFVGLQGGVAALVAAQRHAVWKGLTALLASEDALLGVDDHVLRNGHLELELLAAQRTVVGLFCRVAAAVAPQRIHCVEQDLALGALEGAFL